jgi:hypothetical protein
MKAVTFLIKVVFVIAYFLIISDWQNFKAGLNGKPPITKECVSESTG